jgi:hypothetical protein
MTSKPLRGASTRLRRPAGRPRRVPRVGATVQGAAARPAPTAVPEGVFAPSLPPRGLSLPLAAAYSGIPKRRLWALVKAGTLPVVRLDGMRAVLVLKDDLDAVLESNRAPRALRRPPDDPGRTP